MSNNCRNCLFSEEDKPYIDTTGKEWKKLKCRRYPPTANNKHWDGYGAFPRVGPDTWCGEHKPLPESDAHTEQQLDV